MRKIFAILVVISTLVLTGCSFNSLKYVEDSVETDENSQLYLLEKITSVPDGWKTSKYMWYYYDINTYIVYVGKVNANSYGVSEFVYELKSKDYRNYIYDKDSNTFIGVE